MWETAQAVESKIEVEAGRSSLQPKKRKTRIKYIHNPGGAGAAVRWSRIRGCGCDWSWRTTWIVMDGCFVRFWYSVSVRIQNGVFIISGMEAGCHTVCVWGVCVGWVLWEPFL